MALAGGPGQNPVDRLLELFLLDQLLAGTHREQRGLVDDVREVGACETGRLVGNARQVGMWRDRTSAGVQFEDLGAPVYVWDVDDYLPVEAARSQQRVVEDVRPVGRGHDHDA